MKRSWKKAINALRQPGAVLTRANYSRKWVAWLHGKAQWECPMVLERTVLEMKAAGVVVNVEVHGRGYLGLAEAYR